MYEDLSQFLYSTGKLCPTHLVNAVGGHHCAVHLLSTTGECFCLTQWAGTVGGHLRPTQPVITLQEWIMVIAELFSLQTLCFQVEEFVSLARWRVAFPEWKWKGKTEKVPLHACVQMAIRIICTVILHDHPCMHHSQFQSLFFLFPIFPTHLGCLFSFCFCSFLCLHYLLFNIVFLYSVSILSIFF